MSFKICVVGCGGIAQQEHGPAYRAYAKHHPDVELAACCDIDRSKAEAFQREFGFSRSYTDVDLMLDSEKPQAVCLLVPVNLTCALSEKILGKGYPLLLEKPPGINREEAERMMRAARSNHTPNMVAFNRRHMPLVHRLKELLAEHRAAAGIIDIQYSMLRVGRKDSDFSATAIHGIDLVKNIAGSDYKTVRFHYQELGDVGPGVANIYMDCLFESGAHAALSFCPVSGMSAERLMVNSLHHTFQLHLPSGAIDYPGVLRHYEKKVLKLMQKGSGDEASEEEYVLNGFYDENRVFFDALRNGQKLNGDIESGLQSVEIADCIRKRLPQYEK